MCPKVSANCQVCHAFEIQAPVRQNLMNETSGGTSPARRPASDIPSLRIFGDHSLDKKLTSPPRLANRSEDNNATDPQLQCSNSSDSKWSNLERDGAPGVIILDGTDHTGASSSGFPLLPSPLHPHSNNVMTLSGGYSVGSSSPLTIPVSNGGGVGSGIATHSDWNVISSNSFDDTYLDNDYSSTGITSSSSTSSLCHLNEPMTKLALDTEDHDLPVISMSYPGTSWFLGGKSEVEGNNSFTLPTLGGLTPQSQTSCATTAPGGTSCSISTSSFHSTGADYSKSTGKLPGDTLPCTSDAPSPVQMESFTPCHSHALEPSELLFEDMSTWNGGPAEVYDNQHYHQQHGQPSYNVSSHLTAPNGYLYFDGASTNATTMATPLHDYASLQHHHLHSNTPPAQSMYRGMMQSHDETFRANTRWMANNQYATPSTASSASTSSGKCHDSNVRTGNHTRGPLSDVDEGQAIKRMLRSSTPNQHHNVSCFHSSGSSQEANNSMNGNVMSLPDSNPVATNQSAKIQLLTALNDCYWKNGRKNLQCFPSCPEHHDFYSMKMNNRKHSSVGVCRGPVYCHAFTNAAEFLPASSTQHAKHEHGSRIPCGGNSAREVFVLGRFERVPQQESTNLLEKLNTPPSFSNAAVFEQFRFTCFQAVEMEERRVLVPESPHDSATSASDSKLDSLAGDLKKRFIRSTWFFLPDVWKVQPMLKKKRKATRSAPAQTFPFSVLDPDCRPGQAQVLERQHSARTQAAKRSQEALVESPVAVLCKSIESVVKELTDGHLDLKRRRISTCTTQLVIAMGPPDASKAAGEDGAASDVQQDGVGKVPKITILRLELGTAMKDEAVAHLIQILQTTPNAIEKDIATDMKKYFDQKYGQTWHCIVGKGFGCSIAYDTQFLLFFRADQQYVLLFKSTE
ncbi:unnamed protein product [Phytophthora fragariaefolia]|uniref:Unnamed protein product n=1 Tax=Phytophthora fragariaefolia TaxID=1490495 RepID=A0A9W7CZI2_9STRA|nr:unnamed protein product [Phytophthora fragariaefolia]